MAKVSNNGTNVGTNAVAKVSLGLAIQTQDKEMIKAVVANAIKIVAEDAIKGAGGKIDDNSLAIVGTLQAPIPAEPKIETVHGALPLTSIFDDETLWAQATTEYAKLVQKIATLPEEGKNVAVAKLIAGNAVLRHFGAEASASVDGLI